MRKQRCQAGALLFFLFFVSAGCATNQTLQSARNSLAAGNLELAYDHYQAVLKQSPDNREATDQIKSIGAQIASRTVQEVNAWLDTLNPVTVKDLKGAMARLDQMTKFDPHNAILGPPHANFENRLSQIQKEIEANTEKARSSLVSRQFPAAREQIDLIRRLDSESGVIAKLEEEYQKAYRGFLEEKLDGFLNRKDVLGAKEVFDEISGLALPKEEMSRLAEQFKKRSVEILTEQTHALVKENKFYTAYLKILETGREKDLEAVTKDLRAQGGKFYLEQAKKRFEKGDMSRTYLESVKGLELDQNLPGIFESHRDSRDKVMEVTQKYIAIPAFGAPKDNPDLGPQFSDALISYLFRILPYGINIVEREKIDMLIREQQREFKDIAHILKIDLIVSGNVSLLKIDRQNSESKGNARTQVGQKMEVNPEYEMFVRMYGANTENQKNLPPKLISVPEYQNFQYTKGKVTIKGFANIAARIFDAHKGGIIYAQEFNANYEAADEYQDGVDAAGIKGDVLELPTDTEVAEKLRNKIIPQIAEVIQSQFAKREKTFLEEAKYFIARKEPPKAVDPLAQGFFYCTKAKVDPKDADFKEIRSLILELTEKDYL